MVINGGSRSGSCSYTAYLGMHLQRTDTNERVHVHEMHGMAAANLTDALRQMSAVGEGSRSRLPLYHANIDWRHDEIMTEAQKARAIERLGEELGLSNQPRVVVEHVKEGREHLHVVWSRIDGETMTAIPDSHNYRRHEIVARELEREFQHLRVQGAHHEREGVDRPARCPTLAEFRQAERSGMTPEEAKARLRELWHSADSGQAFAAALDNAGWMLAQGDRRGFVALDPAGEVRAVNKAITGLSAAQMRERLADLDDRQLPTVEQARDQLRERQQQPQPEPAFEIDREADELARLEAMARDFGNRDHGDQAPEIEPVQDNYGHILDDGRDHAHEREADAEARARAADAALAAELEKMRRDIAEHEAGLAELDVIKEAVRDQFRQQRAAIDQAECQAAYEENLARQTQQRGDDSALDAARAMEDLARIDPVGTARSFGHHAGDRFKSPEEMRREWADLMRGGMSAEQATEVRHEADNSRADPAPDVSDAQSRDQAPDHTAERAIWAERLRGFASEPAPETRKEAEPVRERERTPKPDMPTQAPEKERMGLFQRLRNFVRGWFEAAPQPAAPRDNAGDREREAASDREAEHVRPSPARQPAQEPAPQPETDRKQQPEQEMARPAERLIKRDFADELLAEARARLAKQTPEQRAERERSQAELSRGRGDGSRERTRHRHVLLWELAHPPHHHGSRNHRRRLGP